jgi:hypothetical protein
MTLIPVVFSSRTSRILVRHSAWQRGARPAGHFKHELFQQYKASAMRGNPPAFGQASMLHCATIDMRSVRQMYARLTSTARCNARQSIRAYR